MNMRWTEQPDAWENDQDVSPWQRPGGPHAGGWLGEPAGAGEHARIDAVEQWAGAEAWQRVIADERGQDVWIEPAPLGGTPLDCLAWLVHNFGDLPLSFPGGTQRQEALDHLQRALALLREAREAARPSREPHRAR